MIEWKLLLYVLTNIPIVLAISKDELCFLKRIRYQECRNDISRDIPVDRYTCQDLESMLDCSLEMSNKGCTFGYSEEKFVYKEKMDLVELFPGQNCTFLDDVRGRNYEEMCSMKEEIMARHKMTFCADFEIMTTDTACSTLRNIKRNCINQEMTKCFTLDSIQLGLYDLDLAAYFLQSLSDFRKKPIKQMQHCAFFSDRHISNVSLDFFPQSPHKEAWIMRNDPDETYFEMDYTLVWQALTEYEPEHRMLTQGVTTAFVANGKKKVESRKYESLLKKMRLEEEKRKKIEKGERVDQVLDVFQYYHQIDYEVPLDFEADLGSDASTTPKIAEYSTKAVSTNDMFDLSNTSQKEWIIDWRVIVGFVSIGVGLLMIVFILAAVVFMKKKAGLRENLTLFCVSEEDNIIQKLNFRDKLSLKWS